MAETARGATAAKPPTASSSVSIPLAKVVIEVNGKLQTMELDTRTSLLDALREPCT